MLACCFYCCLSIYKEVGLKLSGRLADLLGPIPQLKMMINRYWYSCSEGLMLCLDQEVFKEILVVYASNEIILTIELAVTVCYRRPRVNLSRLFDPELDRQRVSSHWSVRRANWPTLAYSLDFSFFKQQPRLNDKMNSSPMPCLQGID